MDQHANWSDDAAAYALGALDPEEARRFEDHVQTCPECRTALAEMRTAVIALPLGAPQVEVPRQLRRQVLAEVKEDARMRRGQRGAPRRFPLGAGLVPALSGGAAVLAAAVIAIVAIAGGGTSIRTYPGHVAFAHGSASVRVGAGTPDLVVRRMPAPPAGKVYEVWVARGGRPVATSALFDVNRSGAATVAVPASLRGASAVLVTAEPRGGRPHPTSAPVIDVRLG
jgi:anti-sigma-K factor RskA